MLTSGSPGFKPVHGGYGDTCPLSESTDSPIQGGTAHTVLLRSDHKRISYAFGAWLNAMRSAFFAHQRM